jgi:hypothetical protein
MDEVYAEDVGQHSIFLSILIVEHGVQVAVHESAHISCELEQRSDFLALFKLDCVEICKLCQSRFKL